jgi:hypothetical protein
VLGEAAILIGAGAVAGTVIAAAGNKLTAHFLYEVSPAEAGIALLALAALGMVALIAALGPSAARFEDRYGAADGVSDIRLEKV